MTNDFSRYLPDDQQARNWGWRLVDAGRQRVAAGSAYPSGKHPNAYHFDSEGWRRLSEYQIVFIANGVGQFESDSGGSYEVKAGHSILLFPGEKHRYSPEKTKGWTEYWVGFAGREADHIMTTFFSAENPIVHVLQGDSMLRYFDDLLAWLRRPVAAKEQILASHIPLLLALLRSSQLGAVDVQTRDGSLVVEAKAAMLANLSDQTDLKNLSEELGVSYSRFRSVFKKHTGFSPRDYENLIKLNRARDMLAYEGMNVSATAQALGYASVHYFSRAFKQRFGKSPLDWLKTLRSE